MNSSALSDLARQIADNAAALNVAWVLLCAFLIMFMQAGFALVETGLVRAKNVGHTMAMNFFVYAIGSIGFWAMGFALQMGGVGALTTLGGDATLTSEITINVMGRELGIFGGKGFFLTSEVLTSSVATMFLFQMLFLDTAATIPTGALAERWRLSSFVAFTLVISTIIYPIYGNWVWGGGWLSALGREFGLGHGHVDFAGSSVVHMTGGVMAFVGAKMLGPRIGKYGPSGEVNPIPGHNLAMVVTGTFILAFGWFGFNAGSTLAATDGRIAIIAVNTMLASATGTCAAYLWTKNKFGTPDLSMSCNGMLAGLVAVTGSCAFVSAPVAALIGGIAGVLVIESTLFVERKLKVDDPVGAVSVHGVCGTFGVICVGLFANGSYGDGINGVAGGVRGLFYGDGGQLVASLMGIGANLLWVGATATVTFFVLERMVGNRAAQADELAGLDQPELGVPGYFADPEVAIPGAAQAPVNPGLAGSGSEAWGAPGGFAPAPGGYAPPPAQPYGQPPYAQPTGSHQVPPANPFSSWPGPGTRR